MDEYFEALTLIQTKMLFQFPIIIFDTSYHKELIEHIELMKANGTIAEEDLKLCLFTDSIPDAIEHLKVNAISKFGLKPEKPKKSLWWLFERGY
jgi:predicted Rossmann-fold nucleotide-binding protein